MLDLFGRDTLLVETVGVGQSETAVADMVDLFVLLLAPAGGDELQGLKKGIVELADLLLVNKADGDLSAAAGRAAAEYEAALHLLRPTTVGWRPPVLRVSALERRGIDAVWAAWLDYRRALGEAGLAAKRARQARAWMWSEIEAGLRAELHRAGPTAALLKDMESKVSQGVMTPTQAAAAILEGFLGRS